MNLSSRIKTAFILFLLAFSTMIPVHGQDINSLYEPKALIQRLSYENFKNIKLLTTAILNYGGGEEEFNALIDQYSEASALYFSKKYSASAKSFAENEKNIKKTAKKLAAIYKEDTSKLHKAIISKNVKQKIKASLKGDQPNLSAEKFINQGAESILKANDLYERARYIKALYMFRRAKQKCFMYYKAKGEEVPEEFEKDQVDLKNKIYKAKEKKN